MESRSKLSDGFVQRKLPWLIAGGALLFYLFTFSSAINFRGFPTLAKASGWDWRPVYASPLYFLISYPVRWFPIGWHPIVANLIAIISSAGALGFLARSVAILPHDRTREQRHYERNEHSFLSLPIAWIPPLVAVLVCGLQMTFWENAVVATGEAFDLLLFAYVIRCLLEFRLDQRDSWLFRAALVYGLAMTNNFAMVAALPLFVGAVLWIRGRAFFNLRFCLRMLAFGALGLSLYLLLPLIGILSGVTDQTFFEFLKVNLGFQKNAIMGFPRYVLFLLSLVSIFPIIFIGIKWPASFGDINAAGVALTNLMSYVIHAVFLAVCIYVAFDPPFSPRRLGNGMACLPLIYLGALSIGYFTGYFLLVFNPRASGPFGRRSPLRKLLGYAVTVVICIGTALLPVSLFSKNVRHIRAAQGPEFSNFGKLAAASLPSEGGIVLSDDNMRLFAVHSALANAGRANKYVLVDTTSLRYPAYHAALNHENKDLWPAAFAATRASGTVDELALVQLLFHLSQSKPIFYLHPSFGYYFESFYTVPKNVVYQLVPYSSNTLSAPKLTAQQVQENDAFWQQLKATDIKHIKESLKLVSTKKQQDITGVLMGNIYARDIDYFGVELQKLGDLEKAAEYFEFALQINPENLSALINLEYNRMLRAGRHESAPPSEAVKKKLAPYNGNWESVLAYNGPLDEPNSCFLVAQRFANGRNFRQSAQYLERVRALIPENVPAQIAFAGVCVQAGRPDQALEVVGQIRNTFTNLSHNDQLILFECEAWSHVLKNDLPGAEKTLAGAQHQFPDRAEPYKALAEIYLNRGDWTNATATLSKLVDTQPNNMDGLINFAALKMRMGNYRDAIPLLDRALKLQPDNLYALLNHGIANLQTDNLDAARQDYETLERKLNKPTHIVHYALGEIAFKKKQKTTALREYEKYLKIAPRGTEEMKLVQERIVKIKHGAI